MNKSNFIFSSRILVLAMLPFTCGLAQELDKANSVDSAKAADSKFSVKGSIDQKNRMEGNFDLDDNEYAGPITLEPSIDLEFTYNMSKQIQAYLEVNYSHELAIDKEENEKTDSSTSEIDKAFVQFNDFFEIGAVIKKTALTIGRFSTGDNREWFYDTTADGVLISFELKPLNTEFTFSMTRDIDDDQLENIIIAAEHEPFKNVDLEFSAYSIVRRDKSEDNESPKIYGISANGSLADKAVAYWSDFALARGIDDDEKIKGLGFDIGATLSTGKKTGPYVTLSYAFGSGDGDKDSDFRQSDLHGNSDRTGGVASFKYYGELLDPELSNLHIYTAGIGYRFSRSSSVDFIYHNYRQDFALDKLRSNDLDPDPNGVDKDLGNELDIVFGFDLTSSVESEWILGYFKPGAAYDETTEDAFLFEAKFTYNF